MIWVTHIFQAIRLVLPVTETKHELGLTFLKFQVGDFEC